MVMAVPWKPVALVPVSNAIVLVRYFRSVLNRQMQPHIVPTAINRREDHLRRHSVDTPDPGRRIKRALQHNPSTLPF